MATPQVFLAGVVVGVIVTIWLQRKFRKVVPGRAQAEKAKGVVDRFMEGLLGKKKKK